MCKVWALSRSLAATEEVAVAFFSSRYLDVSVPWVCSTALCIQAAVTKYDLRRVAPFGDLRIIAWLAAPRSFSQLPHVLRRLLMPRHPSDTLSSLGDISVEEFQRRNSPLFEIRRGASENSRTAFYSFYLICVIVPRLDNLTTTARIGMRLLGQRSLSKIGEARDLRTRARPSHNGRSHGPARGGFRGLRAL